MIRILLILAIAVLAVATMVTGQVDAFVSPPPPDDDEGDDGSVKKAKGGGSDSDYTEMIVGDDP